MGKLIGGWGAEARSGIPARPSAETRYSGKGVIAAGYIKKGHSVMALSLTDIVERRVNEAEVFSGLLVGNRKDRRPLRRPRAGSAKQIVAILYARNVEIRQQAVQHSGAVRNVGHATLLSAEYCFLLIETGC